MKYYYIGDNLGKVFLFLKNGTPVSNRMYNKVEAQHKFEEVIKQFPNRKFYIYHVIETRL